MPIYLRALTEKSAEQAVRDAIITQTEQKAAEDDYHRKGAIGIKTIEDEQTSDELPVPIKEIEPQIIADTPLQAEQQQFLDDADPDMPAEDNSG
jgi:hypothetical protein